MRYMILVFLVMCGVCFGVDRYINWDSGNDTTGDGTIGTPWKTFSKAYSGSDSGDTVFVQPNDNPSSDPYVEATFLITSLNKSIAYEGASIDAADVVFKGTSGQTYFIRFEGNDTAATSLSFKNMTLTDDGQNVAMRSASSKIHPTNVTLNNVVLNSTATSFRSDVGNGTSSEPDITIVNSTINAGTEAVLLEGADIVTITDTTINAVNSHGLRLKSAIGTVNISNYIFNASAGSGGSAIIGDTLTSLDYLIGRGLTFSVNGSAGTGGSGIRIEDFAANILLDNIVIVNSATTGNVSGVGIHVGKDAPTNANPLGFVSILNATITYTGDVTSHGLLAGSGCDYGRYENITVDTRKIESSVGIGLVIKGAGNLFDGIICRSQRPLYLKGGERNKFINSLYYAYYITDDKASNSTVSLITDVGELPSNNIIENCILFAEAGVDVVVYDADGIDHNNLFDYNCLYGADNIAWLDGGVIADISALRTKWNVYSVLGDENDLNSLEVNPLLDSNDKPQNPQVIHGGRPDVNGNKTSMGAIQATSITGTSIFGATTSIFGDN